MALHQQGMALASSSPNGRVRDNSLYDSFFENLARKLDDIEISKTVSAERTIQGRADTRGDSCGIQQLNKDVFNFYVCCYITGSLLETERLSVF